MIDVAAPRLCQHRRSIARTRSSSRIAFRIASRRSARATNSRMSGGMSLGTVVSMSASKSFSRSSRGKANNSVTVIAMNPIYAPRPWAIKVKFPLLERISPLLRQLQSGRTSNAMAVERAGAHARVTVVFGDLHQTSGFERQYRERLAVADRQAKRAQHLHARRCAASAPGRWFPWPATQLRRSNPARA